MTVTNGCYILTDLKHCLGDRLTAWYVHWLCR